MKAYLIDPNTRTIKEVEYSGNYKDIYKLCDYTCFTTVQIDDNEDTLFVDDEGLKGSVYQFIGVKGFGQPIAGKGLLLGTTEDGNSVSPKMSLEDLKSRIYWIERLTSQTWSAVPVTSPKKTTITNIDALCQKLDDGSL